MRNKFIKNIPTKSGFCPVDLSSFRPLQVVVDPGRFEESCKIFKSIVQKDKILTLFKEKQSFEKPSVKKRRKSREAAQRKFVSEIKQKAYDSGELEKKKQLKRSKKVESKNNE